MARNLTAIGFKFVAIWMILLLFTMVGGPSPQQAPIIALVTALVTWWTDRKLPFALQGWTRWAIDGGLAGFTLYLAQFLWPGVGINFPAALFAGVVIGSVEIPLHFLLVTLFGRRLRDDNHDGIK